MIVGIGEVHGKWLLLNLSRLHVDSAVKVIILRLKSIRASCRTCPMLCVRVITPL